MEREINMNNMCSRAHWENSSMDQNDPFESALSSMVSSPTASASNNGGGENIVLRELIGRLGSICNSNGNNNNNNSSSCYSTPLNSPPKLHLSSNNHHFLSLPTLAPPFSADPIFSRENSTLSDHQIIPNPNPRKRKGKQTIATNINNPASASPSENSDEWSGKRSKSKKEKEKNSSEAEPQKDYIHVRARRGQATDAHSLAERVRREKISERMKVLQDLVPGCNKVTGKAVMLDEIINYVQSLQRQVEFLSMKLSAVNPRMDFNMEALLSKDMFHSLPHSIYPSSDSYPFQSQHNNADAALGRNQGLQLPPMDHFGDAASQVSSLWEDDLHSIVQMGFGTQNFQGIVPTSQMKVEL